MNPALRRAVFFLLPVAPAKFETSPAGDGIISRSDDGHCIHVWKSELGYILEITEPAGWTNASREDEESGTMFLKELPTLHNKVINILMKTAGWSLENLNSLGTEIGLATRSTRYKIDFNE